MLGQGFANARKSQAVSRYHRDLAKEKLKLKDWSEKLQKLYAETDDISDDDELQRLKYAKRNRTDRNAAEGNEKCAKESGNSCPVMHAEASAQGHDKKFNAASSSDSLNVGLKRYTFALWSKLLQLLNLVTSCMFCYHVMVEVQHENSYNF